MNPSLIPAVFIFYGLLSLAYAGTLFLYFKDRKDQSSQSWAIGSLLVGIAVLLTVFRAEIPLIVSYVFANALAYVSYRYQCFALQALLGQRLDFGRLAARCGAEMLGYAIVLIVLGHVLGPAYQTVFVSSAVIVVSLHGARLAYRLYRATGANLALILAITFHLAALLWAIRIVLALADVSTGAFDSGAINTVVFIAIFLVAIFRYMTYPALLLMMANNERQLLLMNSLLRANRTAATGALSAALAHELNQPLGATGLNLDFLRMKLADDALTPQAGAEVLQSLQEDNRRAANIVRSLRSIFSDEPLQPGAHDLADLMGSVLVVVGPALREGGIRLECDPLSGMALSGSRSELQQVFLNLVNNAIQALTAAGTADPCIGIHARRERDTLRIDVTDNGPGVAPSRQASLFALLATDRKDGMGLGLWLCRHIVTRHDGRIWYTPAEQGGSRFSITLPLAHAPA